MSVFQILPVRNSQIAIRNHVQGYEAARWRVAPGFYIIDAKRFLCER